MKIPTTGNVIDVTSGLFGLVLIGSGAWYWYNNVQAQSTKLFMETAAERTPIYGYEPTRDAAMTAFAKSWRRQWPR